MFSELGASSLHKQVFEDRITDTSASNVVLAALNGNTEFGKGFFQAVLGRSILKPGTTQAR